MEKILQIQIQSAKKNQKANENDPKGRMNSKPRSR